MIFRNITSGKHCLSASFYHGARRGSSYLLVLTVSMIIALIGLSGLIAARIDHKIATNTSDATEARIYALAAIEMGIFAIDADPLNWRSAFHGGALPVNMPIGSGTLTLVVVDPLDNDLLNNPTEPIVMTGIGAKGMARHKVQVTVVFTGGVTSFMPGSWKQVVD